MNLEAIYEVIQDHFDYLDRIAAASRPQERKGEIKRGAIVMSFPELDRDLYFVHDVLWVTNNAGVGAWIHYHLEDEGWIDDAARAYRAIGHEQAAQELLAARDYYRSSPPDADYSPFHEHIMCEEEAITRSLFLHLSKYGFAFHTPNDIAK